MKTFEPSKDYIDGLNKFWGQVYERRSRLQGGGPSDSPNERQGGDQESDVDNHELTEAEK